LIIKNNIAKDNKQIAFVINALQEKPFVSFDMIVLITCGIKPIDNIIVVTINNKSIIK
jgi:hypothetical protein